MHVLSTDHQNIIMLPYCIICFNRDKMACTVNLDCNGAESDVSKTEVQYKSIGTR